MERELEYFVFRVNLVDEEKNRLEQTLTFCCSNIQYDREVKYQMMNNEVDGWKIDKQSLILLKCTNNSSEAVDRARKL